MAHPSPGFRRNPGYAIAVKSHPGRVKVTLDGRVIASSTKALELKEGTYPSVFYIPFADIDFGALAPTTSSSHCPYKGQASYWSAGPVADVMWAYQTPYDEMAGLRDHGAFYASKVTIEAA